MKSHYERCRAAAKSTAFKLSLSGSAIRALLHYQSGNSEAPDCRRVRKASQGLYRDGMLDKLAKIDAEGRREFVITDVGQQVFAVLQAAGLLGDTAADEQAVAELKSHYRRFAIAVRGAAASFCLPRSAIELLRDHVEASQHVANCRRHRDAYENLLNYGCVDVTAELDDFGRETYTITDVGHMFYALLVFSGYVPAAATVVRKKATVATSRKR